MKFIDWEDKFSERILRRGYEYYEANCVVDIEAADDVLKAQVKGTEYYSVRIRYTGNEIISMSCTCPYAENYNCKHMAAVLIAVEDIPAQDSPSKKEELEKLISTASEADIHAFLLSLLSGNDALLLRFKISTSKTISANDFSAYKKQIDKIAQKCVDYDEGYIDYNRLSAQADKIADIIQKDCKIMIENGNRYTALEIAKYLFDKFDEFDSGSGYMYEFQKLCDITFGEGAI